MNFGKQLKEGLITQNPVLVQVLGMCSTMAITTSFFNGLGMGVSVLIILTLSNIFIALLRKIIPNEVRIACWSSPASLPAWTCCSRRSFPPCPTPWACSSP